MSFDAGSISSTLSLNTDPFAKGMLKAESLMQVFPQSVTTFMANPLLGVINVAKDVGGALINLGKSGIKLAADMEQSKIAFEVMLGSASNAKMLMGEISKFAASTPFEIPELVGSTRKLIAFGFAQTEVIGQLRQLGDLASALQIPLSDLSDIYGKARVQGRLFMEDINQLSGRGIPITRELARVFGVAETEVRGLVEQGKVGFPQLQQAIGNMTGAGGQFAGMMERQSKSLLGLWSTLQDSISGVERTFGEALVGGGRGAAIVDGLTASVESLQPAILAVGEALGEVMPKLATFLEWGGKITKEQAKNVTWLLGDGPEGRGTSELDQVGKNVTDAGTRDWLRMSELAKRYGDLGIQMKDALSPMSRNDFAGGLMYTRQATQAQQWMRDLRAANDELTRLQGELKSAMQSGDAGAFAAASNAVVQEAKKIESIRDAINDISDDVLTSGNETLQRQIDDFRLGINDAALQAKSMRDAILNSPVRNDVQQTAEDAAKPAGSSPAADAGDSKAAEREDATRKRALERAEDYAFEAEKLRLTREKSASEASIAIFDLETKRKEARIDDLTELWEYQLLRIQEREALIAEIGQNAQGGFGGLGFDLSAQVGGIFAGVDAQVKAAVAQMRSDAAAVADSATQSAERGGDREPGETRQSQAFESAATEIKALRGDVAQLQAYLRGDLGRTSQQQLTQLEEINKKTLPIEGEGF